MVVEREFDVIIFGASGYTGKYAVREAVEVLKNHKWAIAGRNEEKLTKTLKEIGIFLNIDLNTVPIVIADINDEKSLMEITAKAKVLVNLCGPYRFYGEQVVKACIETGTSHVDVSGEPQYMETMQLKYNQAAHDKGVYIVSACGFDSIPADLGTVFLQEKFNGTVNSVELYLRAYFLNDYQSTGAGVHYTTFESAVNSFVHANEISGVRKELFKTKIPKMTPKMKEKSKIHKANDRWSMAIPSADVSVIVRSQRHFYEHDNQRPIQVKSYNTYESLSNALKTVLAGLILKKLTNYNYGKEILLKYPKFFSFGFASHEGPTEMRNINTNFETLLIAEGWKETYDNPNEEIQIPINKKMTARVVCNNPLYGSTSRAVLLAATTIIDERDQIPFNGGVLTPGAAFKRTKFIKKLRDNGFIFEIMKCDELKAKL